MRNEDLADVLTQVADLLEAQDDNRYRVRAYRQAAATIEGLARPAADLLAEGGLDALVALPHVGASIASAIAELIRSGRLGLLERLKGEVSAEDLFTTVPGLGEELARRIHDTLHVESLEELELAAHDGRLSSVPGFGPRRVRAVREELGSILGRGGRQRARFRRRQESGEALDRPGIGTILALDSRYQRLAAAGALPTITPRRFNPRGDAWLPIMHAAAAGWSCTALFSNTALAHRLGRTRDWVVIYAERDGHEVQCTVVTEHQGALRGRRVVRGREAECAAWYRATAA